MYNVTIRYNEGQFLAALDDTEIEGMGETIADSLRDLAENMEALQI